MISCTVIHLLVRDHMISLNIGILKAVGRLFHKLLDAKIPLAKRTLFPHSLTLDFVLSNPAIQSTKNALKFIPR